MDVVARFNLVKAKQLSLLRTSAIAGYCVVCEICVYLRVHGDWVRECDRSFQIRKGGN